MKSSIIIPFFIAVLSLGCTACAEAKKEASTEDSGSDNTVASVDADADGFVAVHAGGDDCDDTDPSLTPEDADLDGFSTCSGDCDDGDIFAYPGAASLDFLYTVEPITGNNVVTCSSVGQRPLTESECSTHAMSLGLSFELSDGTPTDESGCVKEANSGTIQYFEHTQERPCQYPSTCYCFAETLGCMKDEDGDGYGDSTPANDSVLPGTDCDDSEASVNPAGFDEGTDGLDQNCDGVDEAECENDDSFVDFISGSTPWSYNDTSGITGCDNVFTELPWLGCKTWLYWLSVEWQMLGDGNDPTGETLSEYCECQCPDLNQEPPYCVTLTLTDSGGDGWGGGYVRFDMANYTLESGSEISYEVCHFEIDGCTHISFDRGPNPEDHAWTITYGDYLVGSSSDSDWRVGEGCSPMPNTCENCQSLGADRMFCGEGNFGGMFGGCAIMGDGEASCYDGRDEIPGGRFTCVPYNYIPPEQFNNVPVKNQDFWLCCINNFSS